MFKHSSLRHYHPASASSCPYFVKEEPMQKQTRTIGLIQRERNSKTCPLCGCHIYQFVPSGSLQPETDDPFAPCSQCWNSQDPTEALRQTIWM